MGDEPSSHSQVLKRSFTFPWNYLSTPLTFPTKQLLLCCSDFLSRFPLPSVPSAKITVTRHKSSFRSEHRGETLVCRCCCLANQQHSINKLRFFCCSKRGGGDSGSSASFVLFVCCWLLLRTSVEGTLWVVERTKRETSQKSIQLFLRFNFWRLSYYLAKALQLACELWSKTGWIATLKRNYVKQRH